MILEDPTVLGIAIFAVPFVVALVLRRWHRWLLGAGLALAVAWWAANVAQGCDQASEVRCRWQPVLLGIALTFYFGLWVAGTGLGFLVRNRYWRPP